MSHLLECCTERIAASKANGEHLLKMFEMLAADADNLGEHVADLVVFYLEPDDEFEIGKYVPELHLVVRRVEPDDIGETDGT
jgi:hypothetical protein